MKSREFNLGTAYSTIQFVPPNYSFDFEKLLAANTGTVNDVAVLQGLTYDNVYGSVTGTVPFAKISVLAGDSKYLSDHTVLKSPSGVYVVANSVNGVISLTYDGDYNFYRE